MKKKIFKWIGNAITVVLIILVVLSFYSAIQARINPGQVGSILGYKPMPVLSGSMKPVIEVGDMIVAKQISPEGIEVGDVITFRTSPETIVTHRVIEIVAEDGQPSFRTKGDANSTEDQNLIALDQIIGILAFRIPYGGYITRFIRSPIGFILFVILPVVFLIVGELKIILAEFDTEKMGHNKNS